MADPLLYQIGVTMLPGIGNVYARALVNHFGTPEAVFKARRKELELIEGIGEKRLQGILNFDLRDAEKELAFVQKNNIRTLFFQDEGYPKRLLNCIDSPAMLYYKGTADLNASRFVAIVGTRNPSDYGKSVCEELVEEMSGEDIIIISGLAFGIDSVAHRSALKNGLSTIGVLAHGLDRVYPSENRQLAAEMLSAGGLLSEFRHETIPDRQNFPSRNRIVAGLCDCIVVIESGMKGGSLITAELGNGYNKDVFAFPGRTTDIRSSGCNFLIKTNRAGLITGARDLLLNMGWAARGKAPKKVQRELFIELEKDEQKIYDLLKTGITHIDDIHLNSEMSGSMVAQSLLMLEMKGIVSSLPGKKYELI